MPPKLPETQNREAEKSALPVLTSINALDKLSFTKYEVCQMLGVSTVTLWRWEKAGRLRPVPDIGTKIYPRAELERFLTLPKKGPHAK